MRDRDRPSIERDEIALGVRAPQRSVPRIPAVTVAMRTLEPPAWFWKRLKTPNRMAERPPCDISAAVSPTAFGLPQGVQGMAGILAQDLTALPFPQAINCGRPPRSTMRSRFFSAWPGGSWRTLFPALDPGRRLRPRPNAGCRRLLLTPDQFPLPSCSAGGPNRRRAAFPRAASLKTTGWQFFWQIWPGDDAARRPCDPSRC